MADLLKQCEEKKQIPEAFEMSPEEAANFFRELQRLYCNLQHKKIVTDSVTLLDGQGKQISYDEVLASNLVSLNSDDQLGPSAFFTQWQMNMVQIRYKDYPITVVPLPAKFPPSILDPKQKPK